MDRDYKKILRQTWTLFEKVKLAPIPCATSVYFSIGTAPRPRKKINVIVEDYDLGQVKYYKNVLIFEKKNKKQKRLKYVKRHLLL